MKLHLRFGMHRDVQLMHEEKDKFDGFIVPAHILAHQPSSTGVFVTSLHDKPHVIDPMTFILQNKKSAHIGSGGKLKPSIAKLFNEYHPDLESLILNLSNEDSILLPTSYPPLAEICANCLDFQMTKVASSAQESKAAKYLKRYASVDNRTIRLAIPPYFYFEGTTDRFYVMSLECARIFVGISSVPVAPVILCRADALAGRGVIDRIVSDYSSFQTVFLWMDDFSQATATSTQIANVRRLVKGLSRAGVSVEALYGGFLLMAMREDGISAISHGILYTQHKAYTLTPGSGGAPERYYIPGIWEFRSMSQADIILHQRPDLMCGCSVCRPIFKNNPDNIVLFTDEPDLLRRHFLTVRRIELDRVEAVPASQLCRDLREAYATYHNDLSALHNPDSMMPNTTIQGLQYLRNWADGLSTII